MAAGFGAGGLPPAMTVLAGQVRKDGRALVLDPGAAIEVGEGIGLEVWGTFPGTDIDLGRGAFDGPHVLAHFGAVSGLYRHDGATVGDDPRFSWGTKSRARLELRCDRLPELRIDRKRLGLASPGEPCPSGPLWIRAVGEARIFEITRDGVTVPLTPRAFDRRVAAAVLSAGGVLSLLFGLRGWYPLLLAPLALFGPELGLPVFAVACLLVGTAFMAHATTNAGVRRWLAVGGALFSLALALHGVLRATVARPSPIPPYALKLVDMGFVTRKVEVIVRNGRERLAARPMDRPLVLVLGSSSSRPGPQGESWPDPLQERVPHLAVVTLAEGGATSWHMRRAMEQLEVRPDVCVAYLGHNDSSPSFPGLTIAALERGEQPVPGVWSPLVSLMEAKENFAAIAQQCGATIVMQEHSAQRAADMVAYAGMIRELPTVRHLDVSARLAGYPPGLVMRDDVHLSAAGDKVVARAVAEVLVELLPPEPRPKSSPLPGDGDPEPAVSRP